MLHLSSSIHGGAGIAAQRLNQALLDLGIDSKLLTLSPVDGGGLLQIQRNLYQLFFGKLNSFFARLVSRRTFFSMVSINSVSIRDIRRHLSPEEGVIHIHNWFNLVSEAFIFRLIEKGFKVVLTLHDERLLTGGCHYSLNCRQFEKDCGSCPEISKVFRILPSYVFSRNKAAINKLNRPLELIAPSHWMAGEASRSRLLDNANIHIIPNSLNGFGLNTRRVTTAKKLKSINEIFKLGVASMDPTSYIKCGDLINALYQDAEFNVHFELIFMADYSVGNRDAFWGDIDVLLVASRIDNSPNVIHEAKSLGIPVIGTNVGGIPELLTSTDFLIEVSNLSTDYFLKLKKDLFAAFTDGEKLIKEQDKFTKWSMESALLHLKYYTEIID